MAGYSGYRGFSDLPTELTSLAADDLIAAENISEVDAGLAVGYITLANFFGATTPLPVNIALERVGVNSLITFTRNTAVEGYMNATTTGVNLGTVNNYPVRLSVFSSAHFVEVTTGGIIRAADVYANDLNGGTIRTMVIDDSGNMGYDSSTMAAKTITGALAYDSAKWILDIPLISYTPKANPSISRVGYTAESIYELSQGMGSDTLVFFDTHEIISENNTERISTSKYKNWHEIQKAGEIGKRKTVTAKKILNWDIESGHTTEDVEIEIEKKVQGVNHTELIAPMIAVIQKQQEEIEFLKNEVKILKEG